MPKKKGERLDTVKFHEYEREYYWHIPSGNVQNRQGQIVATGCYNLRSARDKVRLQHK